MTQIIKSRRRLSARLKAKQDISDSIPALMGDGNGNIDVDVVNQPGQVYIRVGDGDLGQAFNNRVPRADNLAIDVGYDPITDPQRRIFQVLNVRMADYAGAGNTPFPNVGPHHETHEFGGGDDTYISWRRLMGFRVGRPAGFVITIDQGNIIRAGAWLAVLAQTIDLTASKPALSTQARYVLITLDSAGVASSTNGALVATALLDISDCPVPAAGEIPLAAVRMYGTQTSIGDIPSAPDIVDLRFPQAAMTGAIYLADLDGYARGNIIRGGAADWEAYALAGAAGSFLRRDATDVLWSTLTLPNAATIGDILHATGANAIGNLADVAVGSVLISGGIGAVPSYSASPTLTGLTLSGLTPSTVIYSDAGRVIVSLANAVGYLFNNGAGALSYVAAPLPGIHNVLDSTYHGDVLTGAITRGDILYGNATPKIARLALGGITGSILTRDATDVLWSTGALSFAGAFTLTIPATGTAVLTSRTITSGNGLTGGGDLSADRTLAVGAGTLITVGADTVGITPGASQYQVITSGATPFAAAWSGYLLDGTAGGKMNFAVTNTKTLTLTATDNYNLTIPATGTAALLGVANSFTALNTFTVADATIGVKIAGATGRMRFYGYSSAALGSTIQSVNTAEDTFTPLTLDGSTVSIRLSGLHVGGTSDPGNDNLLVDGTATITGNTIHAAKITTYNNVATEGYGVPAIVDDVALVNQGADIGSTNFTNAGTAGTYRVSYYIFTKTVDAAAGTVTLVFGWTDDYGARTDNFGVIVLTGSSYKHGVVHFQIASGSVAYSTTHIGSFGNARFNLYMTCERLS